MAARAQRLFAPAGLREPEPITVLSHGKGQRAPPWATCSTTSPTCGSASLPASFSPHPPTRVTSTEETQQHVRYLEAFYERTGEHFEHVTPELGYHTATWRSLEQFPTLPGTALEASPILVPARGG